MILGRENMLRDFGDFFFVYNQQKLTKSFSTKRTSFDFSANANDRCKKTRQEFDEKFYQKNLVNYS